MVQRPKCFQQMILDLQQYWARWGCAILQPYDVEMGAGTFHPATMLRSLGSGTWNAAYVQPSRRPTDGRYGENPNRTQYYYQFQVIMKPGPQDCQQLYLDSLRYLGIDIENHDIRFVEDDWESPTLGAAGLGWEVWCDGMEISQFTYFQQVGGFECEVVPVEITYGLERVALNVQDVDNFFQLDWNGVDGCRKLTYRDISMRGEQEFSHYNFTKANTAVLLQHFKDAEQECMGLLSAHLALPAYDHCIKASHLFNLLDARGVMSVTERASYIGRVRNLAKKCCEIWLNNTEKKA